MTARIYSPAKTATQSGLAKTNIWRVEFEPEVPRVIEPLMGWTSSSDMKQQLTLNFETREAAVSYCEQRGIAYQVFEAKPVTRRIASYSDNFKPGRAEPWTH
jgi:hypothetical protein